MSRKEVSGSGDTGSQFSNRERLRLLRVHYRNAQIEAAKAQMKMERLEKQMKVLEERLRREEIISSNGLQREEILSNNGQSQWSAQLASPVRRASKVTDTSVSYMPRGWQQARDAKSGKIYYYSVDENKTSWTLPSTGDAGQESAPTPATPLPAAKKPGNEVFSRLTDVEAYTGIYKKRFQKDDGRGSSPRRRSSGFLWSSGEEYNGMSNQATDKVFHSSADFLVRT